jgi:hypothetical protein
LTFSLRGKQTPFVYEYRVVEIVVIDDSGNVLETGHDHLVIVSGTTSEAQATVDYFALNTPWYSARDRSIVIPDSEYRAGNARLPWQRARVYSEAHRLVDAFEKAEDGETLHIIVQQGRRLMAAAGFWSTWATVIRERDVPMDVTRDLFQPPPPDDWRLGGGGHRPFPGTNPAILDVVY